MQKVKKEQPIRQIRENEDRKMVKDVIAVVKEEDEEIEEVYRPGKYRVGRNRPIKVKLTHRWQQKGSSKNVEAGKEGSA